MTTILVAVKRVPDPDTRIRLGPGGSAIDDDGVRHAINPFDAIALEEALRLRERLPGARVVAVSIGAEACAEQLQSALAMGADRALLVLAEPALDSLGVAKVLAGVCRRERPDLVLLGKQAIDDDSNQAGQMLAGLLGFPQATFVSKVEWLESGLRCHRETDAGIEVLGLPLPAVITADLRLNEPRYISPPSILKAKKKSLERIPAQELAADLEPRTRVLRLESTPRRKAGVRVKTVADLVGRLRGETGLP